MSERGTSRQARERSRDIAGAREAIVASYPPLDGVFNGSRPIVIAAAARMGRAFLAALRSRGVTPVAFADNDTSKWGSAIEGVPVLPPADSFDRHPTATVCVASLLSEWELTDQMRQLGFEIVYPLTVLNYYHPDVFVAPYLAGTFESCFDPVNIESIERVRALWADDESILTFERILEARRSLSVETYKDIRARDPQYFPPNVVTLTSDDVFCDAGAFTGDTFESYRATFPNLTIPYCGFEPDPSNYESLVRAGVGYPGPFEPVQAGLGASASTMLFSRTGGMDGSFLTAAGSVTVPIHTLDQFFAARTAPTFIKMDIEGMELDALSGGASLVKNTKPTLAICVYHWPTHLWQIPLWAHGQNPDYRFYLRHYSTNMSETVMYAIR
jgi:FkbM family methyltransferase